MPPDHTINFMEFLTSFRRGQLMREADKVLRRITEAMMETGNDGEITIKLPLKFNKAGQIEIDPKITVKIPQTNLGTGIYFVDDDGRMTRRDPAQLDIEDEIARQREVNLQTSD